MWVTFKFSDATNILGLSVSVSGIHIEHVFCNDLMFHIRQQWVPKLYL